MTGPHPPSSLLPPPDAPTPPPDKPLAPEVFARIKQLIEVDIPFNRVIGMELVAASEGRAQVRFAHRPELMGNYPMGMLHGGVITSVLDVTGAVGIITLHPTPAMIQDMGTVDLRADFLAPGVGQWFVCHAQVLRRGKTLATARTELYNDANTLVAVGTAIYRVRSWEPKRED